MVYRPTARVLTVLELLQSHGRMTGAELAHRLEVDIRTIRNYVQTLLDLGIPVEAERGRYGAYRLRPGYKLPPLIFTEDEALALTLSLLLARNSGFEMTTPAIEGVLAKVERVLPETTRARIQAVEQTVGFERGSDSAPPESEAVMALSSAIKLGRRVFMRYQSGKSQLTERQFDPYGVAFFKGFWYTIGYCHLRKGERLFRLDRIMQIEMTRDPFPPRVNFPALEEIQRALAHVKREWHVEVWLETTLEEAQRQTRLPKAFFEESNAGVLLRIDVGDLPWMARLLAGLGTPFLIHHPPELREVVHQYALTLAGYAKPLDE